jgi:hypothetical protein
MITFEFYFSPVTKFTEQKPTGLRRLCAMAKLKRKIAESRILSLAKQVFIRINIEDIFVLSSLVISYLKNKFDTHIIF